MKLFVSYHKQILFFLIYGIIAGGNATAQTSGNFSVKMIVPDSIPVGSEIPVELVINNIETDFFATFNQKLPKGTKALPINTGGGEMTIENHDLQITWIRLRKNDKISILYKIIKEKADKEKMILGGHFSYMSGNKQGIISIPYTEIKFYSQKKENTSKADTNAVKNNTSKTEINKIKNDSTKIKITQTLCTRALPVINEQDGSVTVSLQIEKGDMNAAARVTESIPADFEAFDLQNEGAVFSFTDNNVSFIWNRFPAKETIEIRYVLKPKTGKIKQIPDINGQLLYVKDGKVIPQIVKRNY